MSDDPEDGPGGGPLSDLLSEVGLVDHHAHGALRGPVEPTTIEAMLTEAPSAPRASSVLDTQLGFAIRRWCAPLLGLPAHASADEYWDRRADLGEDEVNRRLLRAAGVTTYLLDTGFGRDRLLTPAEHAEVSGAQCHEVVRLETVAEDLLAEVDSPAAFVRELPGALARATRTAVATKSVIAYRAGLDVDLTRPGPGDVRHAVERMLVSGSRRVTDPVLLAYLLWAGIDRGLPVQVHCGYGDRDLDLHRANPVLLTAWLRAVEPTGVPVMLLHNYPFQREAGYLAQVFEHVHLDVGLGVHYTGAQSRQLVAESLELAPFHKLLHSSDGCGPAELHYLGATLWRRATSRVLGEWVADGDWSRADAERVVRLVAHENAERVYGL